MARVAEASPRLKASLAGALYLLSVLVAVFAEFFDRRGLGFAAVLIPISGYVAVTLLLYGILKPVGRSLALLAMTFGLAGLTLEALQLQTSGVNIAMVLHGFYCLLIGWLILRSTFLPRILGTLMALAGLVWLMYLLPPLANQLSPYNTAFGIVGEGLPMLWLLVKGVNVQRWKEQASAAGERRSRGVMGRRSTDQAG